MGMKLMIYGIIFAVVAGMIGGFWWNYNALIKRNAQLTEDKTKLTGALAQSQETVKAATMALDDFAENQKVQLELMETMVRVGKQANKETERLNGILAKHDLGKLARAKPRLVERRINAGTKRIMGLLRGVTDLDNYKTDRSEATGNKPRPPAPAVKPKAGGVQSPDAGGEN